MKTAVTSDAAADASALALVDRWLNGASSAG